MAACPLCKREMLFAVSCNTDPFIIGAKVYEPLPWGKERRSGRAPANFACADCGTPSGGIHHHGCDVEECPVCRGQAIGCRCDEVGEWDHHRARRRRAVRTMRPKV